MKEFIEKLIGRLEEKIVNLTFDESIKTKNYAYKNAIEIVNELAEEHSANTTQKSANGWIPCSERLPQESEPVGTLCEIVNVMLKNGIVTSGWCNRYLEKWYVLDHYHDYPLPYEYKDVIAWQPLPQPYKPQKNEWKDAVMKHFTKTE